MTTFGNHTGEALKVRLVSSDLSIYGLPPDKRLS
ncbi:hypothetical protein PXNS11_350123 [Stutzerimonas xanthomarina]|nr:hypothetical protein PXNS11_350123 [Stutzerimonas xanthomarina]